MYIEHFKNLCNNSKNRICNSWNWKYENVCVYYLYIYDHNRFCGVKILNTFSFIKKWYLLNHLQQNFLQVNCMWNLDKLNLSLYMGNLYGTKICLNTHEILHDRNYFINFCLFTIFFFRLAISVLETIHYTKLKNTTFSRKNLAGIFLPVFFNNQII